MRQLHNLDAHEAWALIKSHNEAPIEDEGVVVENKQKKKRNELRNVPAMRK